MQQNQRSPGEQQFQRKPLSPFANKKRAAVKRWVALVYGLYGFSAVSFGILHGWPFAVVCSANARGHGTWRVALWEVGGACAVHTAVLTPNAPEVRATSEYNIRTTPELHKIFFSQLHRSYKRTADATITTSQLHRTSLKLYIRLLHQETTPLCLEQSHSCVAKSLQSRTQAGRSRVVRHGTRTRMWHRHVLLF